MAFAAFIAAALDGGSAPLIADGKHLRHFTHIGDVVDATVRALERAPAGTIYNVAGPEPVAVIDALRLIERSLGKPVPVQRLPAHDGEALRTRADISRARHELDWRPRVALLTGLRRQIDHALGERKAQLRRRQRAD